MPILKCRKLRHRKAGVLPVVTHTIIAEAGFEKVWSAPSPRFRHHTEQLLSTHLAQSLLHRKFPVNGSS